MRWLLAAMVTLVLHYGWEMLQAPLFTNLIGMRYATTLPGRRWGI